MALDRLYSALPAIRELRSIRDAVWSQNKLIEDTLVHLSRSRIAQRLSEPRFNDPRHLNRFEHQVFSQNGEDGIIAEILRRIGVSSAPGSFAEIGVGNGLENNTGYLLAQGWKGAWLEGDSRCITQLKSGLRPYIEDHRLKVVETFVTRENVLACLESTGLSQQIDFLSIDVDQNTFWIWDGLNALRPKVIVVEYNATWPPGVDWTVAYNPKATWDGTFAFGASLTAFTRLGLRLGYRLVACDLCGINAFFVRADLVEDQFLGPFDAETHYHPPDYLLSPATGMPRGFAAYYGQGSGVVGNHIRSQDGNGHNNS